MARKAYKMTISLNVLNHLGINLYSNIPAVLSEVVANAWDADAKTVDIIIKRDEISIIDDGCGMSYDDLNNKYLYVGYIRREQPNEAETPIFKRPVMGRKGIGKLSLFSIADTIEIQSMRKGQKNGFVMSAKKIQEQLKSKKSRTGNYRPDPLPKNKVKLERISINAKDQLLNQKYLEKYPLYEVNYYLDNESNELYNQTFITYLDMTKELDYEFGNR